MKKVLCAILALVILLALAGCRPKTDADIFVGKWHYDVDVAAFINENLETGGSLMAEFFPVDSMEIRLIWNFKKDGTYTVQMDDAVKNNSLDKYSEVLRNGMTAYLENLIKENKLNVTVEKFLEDRKKTQEDLVKEIRGSMDTMVTQLFKQMMVNGKYRVDNGRLYGTTGITFDSSVYNNYEIISNKEIHILSSVGTQGNELDLYPIKLIKK